MRALAVVVLALLVLVGCTPAPEVDEAREPSSSAEPTPTPTPTLTPEFEALDPSLFFVDGLSQHQWGSWDSQDVNFASPSGKIGCAILGAEHDELWGCAVEEGLLTFDRDDPSDFCFEAQIACGDGIEVSGGDIPHPRKRGDPGFPAAFVVTAATTTPSVRSNGGNR